MGKNDHNCAILSRRAALLGLGAAAVMARRAAAAPSAAALDAKASQQAQQVQTYLNSIRTMQSRFEQVADDGGVAYGTIYLQRPGKMRIVYDPPVADPHRGDRRTDLLLRQQPAAGVAHLRH